MPFDRGKTTAKKSTRETAPKSTKSRVSLNESFRKITPSSGLKADIKRQVSKEQSVAGAVKSKRQSRKR